MAWWDDIRDMLRQDLAPAPARPAPQAAPAPLRQARQLLSRTAHELAEARGRAETVARRLARAQAQLEALTRAPQPHPRYHARLLELSRAIARDSGLAGGFQAHLAQLDLLHDEVSRQLRELDHDLDMARAASTLGQATDAVARRRATRAGAAAGSVSTKSASTKSASDKSVAAKPRSASTKKKASPHSAPSNPESPIPNPSSKGFRRARAGRVLATLEKLPPRRPGRRDED